MDLSLKMTGQQVEDLVHLGFGSTERKFLVVEDLQPGHARVRVPFRKSMLRPGGVLSGPSLFMAADTAMYVLLLGHIGPQVMAVTSDFNMHFLNKAAPGDIITQTSFLKLGRRLAVMEVALYSSADAEKIVAKVTGSYALPGDSKA